MGQNHEENWCLPQRPGREASKNSGEESDLSSIADVRFSLAQSASPFPTVKLCARWGKIQTSVPPRVPGCCWGLGWQQGSGSALSQELAIA